MIRKVANGGNITYNISSYLLDTKEELTTLPSYTTMGSTALILSTGEVYIKAGDATWKIIGNNFGGGGSVDPTLIKQIKENTAQIALLNDTINEQSAITASLKEKLANTISTEEIEALGDEGNA